MGNVVFNGKGRIWNKNLPLVKQKEFDSAVWWYDNGDEVSLYRYHQEVGVIDISNATVKDMRLLQP